MTGPSAPARVHALDSDAGDDRDALALEGLAELVTDEWLLPVQQPLIGVDDRHLVGPEPPPGLCHLHADCSAAEHEQPAGHGLGRGGATAVPEPDLGQPVDGWHGGAAASGDHDSAASDEPSGRPVGRLHVDDAFAHQATMAAYQCSPGTFEPLDLAGVVPIGGDPVAAGESAASTSSSPVIASASARHSAGGREHLPGSQQRLARHARPVGALAAQELCLDHRYRESAVGAAAGDVLPCRTAADHHHIELISGLVAFVALAHVLASSHVPSGRSFSRARPRRVVGRGA